MLANDYGPMKSNLRRVVDYQKVYCKHQPGYGPHFYLIRIEEAGVGVDDVFEIRNDGHLNSAINVLMGKLYAQD